MDVVLAGWTGAGLVFGSGGAVFVTVISRQPAARLSSATRSTSLIFIFPLWFTGLVTICQLRPLALSSNFAFALSTQSITSGAVTKWPSSAVVTKSVTSLS